MSTSTPSMEYLNAVWQFLPQGHEKPLKQAFYNTIANIFVLVAAAVAVAVYFILAPFIRPLYWAVLCGTFLYPFKRSLTSVLRQWLKGLQCSGTPFALGLTLLPLQIGNSVAETMTRCILANMKLLLGILVGLPSMYLLYHFTPLNNVFPLLQSILTWLYEFLEYFGSNWVWTFFIAYMLCVVFLWKSSSQQWLRYLSAPVWVSLLLHFGCVAGPLRIPLFILIVSVLVIGVLVQMGPTKPVETAQNCEETSTPFTSFCSALFAAIGYSQASATGNENETTGKLSSETAILEESPVIQPPGDQEPSSSQKIVKPAADLALHRPSKISLAPSSTAATSVVAPSSQQDGAGATKPSMVDQCFWALLCGHIIVRLWMHVWLIFLLFILPILHLAFKKICQQFCPGGLFHKTKTNSQETAVQWLKTRQDVLMPRCLRGLGCLMLKGDQKIISILEQGLDQATSILLILILLVGTFVFTVIGAVQIQRESMYMITSTQNLLNKTMNSEFSQWMPNADMMRKTMDQVLHKTHEHGRNFIASKVKDFLPVDQSSEETENIINQVLEVWDKLYETMLSKEQSNTSSAAAPPQKQLSNMDTLWQSASQAKNMLQISAAVEFVKENLGMFMSVLESVWTVLKSNMNLFFTVITTILSAVLGGGTAILNFVISAIIFLTTLFYLLASSGDMYKPAELFSNMSPGSAGSRFGTAVEHAISGVFMASLKMATFYGLYTWLVHLIFGLDIVFIPSALAACFAAIPFLGPYWAALPAVIELWLVQGQGLNALLLFLAHMMPAYVVDTAIYREIDGSHPYVTGLAIAGGILFMGLEGAIIGPIILCCLIVVLNMYSNMLHNDPSTPSPARHNITLQSLLAQTQRGIKYRGPRSVSSDAIHVH